MTVWSLVFKLESNLGIILDFDSSRSVTTNQRVFLSGFGNVCQKGQV